MVSSFFLRVALAIFLWSDPYQLNPDPLYLNSARTLDRGFSAFLARIFLPTQFHTGNRNCIWFYFSTLLFFSCLFLRKILFKKKRLSDINIILDPGSFSRVRSGFLWRSDTFFFLPGGQIQSFFLTRKNRLFNCMVTVCTIVLNVEIYLIFYTSHILTFRTKA